MTDATLVPIADHLRPTRITTGSTSAAARPTDQAQPQADHPCSLAQTLDAGRGQARWDNRAQEYPVFSVASDQAGRSKGAGYINDNGSDGGPHYATPSQAAKPANK